MRPRILYRTTSVLIVIFAIGHTLGLRQVDPKWGADSLVSSMQSLHFSVQGFSRSYWDFFVGFGYFLTVLFLFVAALCWQLGGLPAEVLAHLRWSAWALAIGFVALAILSWTNLFITPIVFTIVIAVLLILAAARLPKPTA